MYCLISELFPDTGFVFSTGSVQLDGLKMNMLQRGPWKYGNLSKKLSSIGKAYPDLNVIWMLTTPLHRSSCSCQIAVFRFCCWNFWTIFGDVPDWLANGALCVCWVIKDLWQATWDHILPKSLAAPITNKLKKKWLNNTEYHLERGLIGLGPATKALLNDVMVSAEKKRKFLGQFKQMVVDMLLKLSERSP